MKNKILIFSLILTIIFCSSCAHSPVDTSENTSEESLEASEENTPCCTCEDSKHTNIPSIFFTPQKGMPQSFYFDSYDELIYDLDNHPVQTYKDNHSIYFEQFIDAYTNGTLEFTLPYVDGNLMELQQQEDKCLIIIDPYGLYSLPELIFQCTYKNSNVQISYTPLSFFWNPNIYENLPAHSIVRLIDSDALNIFNYKASENDVFVSHTEQEINNTKVDGLYYLFNHTNDKEEVVEYLFYLKDLGLLLTLRGDPSVLDPTFLRSFELK